MNYFKIWSNFLLFFSVILALLGFNFLMSELSIFLQFNFTQINSCKVELLIIMDWISLIFSSAVLLISSMVVKFSSEYMEYEPFSVRFLYLVLMFVLSMLLLIFSPNLMSILLGWDGLGLVSYCLVIYYQNPRSYNAGMLTVLSNRIGDVLILLSIAMILPLGTWNIISLNLSPIPVFISLLIMMAAMTKSAQIPFSAWLPAAMAAPTPVSALVHSSTLVTAGVYLLIRFHNMFINNTTSIILLLSSCLTMLMAGINATLETDMKKVIALSTLSQLGIMMMAISLNLWTLAYFHMITHAMFKSLLFLCAGFIIHNTKNNQDIRKMGIILFSSPMTSTAILTSSLALMGFPFLAGFYSKDLILEQSMKSLFLLFLMTLILISFGMTMMYSIRLPIMSLIMSHNLPSSNLIQESKLIKSSILTLSIMTISTGTILSWTIFPTPSFSILPMLSKMMGIMLIFSGIILSISIWMMTQSLMIYKNKIKTFMSMMWFLPYISTITFTPLMILINNFKHSELGWNEFLGAQKMYQKIQEKSSIISKMQNNMIHFFMMTFMISLFLFISLYSM